jgi:hypothetical protein
MNWWLLLFIGLTFATLAGLMPSGGAIACRVIAVVTFALGAAWILIGMA